MKKKGATLDTLALMVGRGFQETHKELGDFRNETEKCFEQVDKRFEQIDSRFDRIESILLQGHERRIERLEDTIRILKTKAGIR